MNTSVSRVPGLIGHPQITAASLVLHEQVNMGKLGETGLRAKLSAYTTRGLRSVHHNDEVIHSYLIIMLGCGCT
jgi:peptidyl-tRNA hydrolase